jgi:LacI family transcriptional regulator
MIVHDLTETTRAWLREDLVDVVIDQNARLVGEQAVIRLLGSIATTAPFPPLRYIEPRILLRENVPA